MFRRSKKHFEIRYHLITRPLTGALTLIFIYTQLKLRKMKLITLAKNLDFNTETEYFDYCINSYENGNKSQCKELFNDMAKADRKRLIEYIAGCYDHPESKDVYNFYFSLL